LSKVWKRKGAHALFLFFGVLVSAWASGTAEAAVWHWACALLLLALAIQWAVHPAPSWTGAAVGALAGWTLFHTVFLAESYSPAGLYQPLFLLAGFALGRRSTAGTNATPTAVAMWSVVAIACFSLASSAYAGGAAAAPFETPAVLAAVINLALLPVLVHSLWGPKVPPMLCFAQAILFAGLVGASSRGGWIGVLVGLGFATVVLRARRPEWPNIAATVLSCALGGGLALLLRLATPLVAPDAPGQVPRAWAGLPTLFGSTSVLQLDSSVSRLELYSLALEAALARLPLGAGYLSFGHILEAGRERVPSFGSESVTFFVHCDYLQALLELGVPGLLTLLMVTLLPLALVLRHRTRLMPETLVPAAACSAAVAAMAFQAGVDFPFYIPICLALFGLQLGTLDRIVNRQQAGAPALFSQRRQRPALSSLRRVAVAIGLVLLIVPVAAELSLAYGKARWKEGLGEEAAYGFELARRLQPSDWRYAWFAGKFWTAQAAGTRNAEAAKLADAAYASGFAASPMEVKNLLGRIEVHRNLGQLLPSAASAGELEAWSAKALALAPLNPRVRTERIFVLEKSGKIDAARLEAARLARDEPHNKGAWFLAERLARRMQ
jgi:hypothetical protein